MITSARNWVRDNSWIAGLLGFVGHFYYSLHASLLEKSGLLAVTGLCLIAAHFLLRRFFPAAPAPETGDA